MAEKKAVADTINKASSEVEPLFAQIQACIDKDGPNPDKVAQEKAAADVEPLINKAKCILNDSNEKVRSVDPDGKIAAEAQGKSVDSNPSAEDEMVGRALTNLIGTLIGGIEYSMEKVTNMPILKSKTLPFLIDLLIPAGEIVAGVLLLLGAVLNLVTDVLGLQKLAGILVGAKLGRLAEGLNTGQLLSKLGLDRILGDVPGVEGMLGRLGLGSDAGQGGASDLNDLIGGVGQAVNGVPKNLGTTADQTPNGVGGVAGGLTKNVVTKVG